ncbi:MAG: hypothetical protein WDZ66_12155 [Steroidobacteraceae bacterium]
MSARPPEANDSPPTILELILGLFTGAIADAWFRWVEWILVSAALYALGVFTDSDLLKGMAYFSAMLTGAYAINRISDFIKRFDRAANALKSWHRFAAIAVSAAVQVWMFLSIGKVLSVALNAKMP